MTFRTLRRAAAACGERVYAQADDRTRPQRRRPLGVSGDGSLGVPGGRGLGWDPGRPFGADGVYLTMREER